jgi:hypothetical protein
LKIRQDGPWGSLFKKPHHKNYTKLVERPLGLEQGWGAGREGNLFYEGSLLGLSWAEF